MKSAKIFFDVSGLALHLKYSENYSGIQRAVVNLIAETANLLGDDRVYLSYYDRLKKKYICVSMLGIQNSTLLDPKQLSPLFGSRRESRYGFSALSGYAEMPMKYRFHRAKFAFNALISNKGFFTRRQTSIEKWKKYRAEIKANTRQRAKVDWQNFSTVAEKDDHLILLDSSWTVQRSIKYFEAAAVAGLKVHVLVHDLIPLVRPDLVPSDAPIKLYDWLISTSKFATSYMANSEATRVDFEEFLKLHGIKKELAVVPLAQAMIGNFVSAEDTALFEGRQSAKAYTNMVELALISNSVRGLGCVPYVLCVGTLETRKNNWRIAMAWALLRDVLPIEKMPRLIFAGRQGWMNDDFNMYMKATGNLGGLIQVVSCPSDEELAFLYRNCQFTLMASLYEGWGLPVGESLSAGKTAIVSNTSSLPEVGGDLVRYCDPLSPNSIMQACKDLIVNPNDLAELEARIRNADLRNWSDVAADMIGATVQRDQLN
jgi:glycosyltransferase involved in cell wall biosynthesis